jgi:serine/threonine-protein kinase
VGLPPAGPPPGYPPGYGEPDPRTSTGDVRLPAPPPPVPPRQQAWRGLALLMTGLAVALAIAVVFVVVRGGADVAAPEPDRAVGLPEVPVPDLRGRDVADATNALQSIGLEIVVASPTPDPSAPPNTILDSNPPADALAAPGTLVRVFVSGGPPAEPIPAVGGLERGGAERILREAGFTPAPPREEESRDVAQGLVIRSDPAEGEEAAQGTPVQLVLSSGPPPFTLSRLIGLSESDAVRQLEAAGLRPDVLRRFSTAPVGQVIDQAPDGGVEVREGDTVTITISLGQ